jgi:hypothetical protein
MRAPTRSAARRRRGGVDPDGTIRVRRHKLPLGEREVLITDHHRGFIDWDTFQANQIRIRGNTRPKAHEPGTGAVREGCALLQGLATCGTCGRKLAVYYYGPTKTTPGYYCTGTGTLVEGKGTRHLRVGGATIDTTVAEAFLTALQPAALQACLAAADQLEDGHHAALDQWRRQVDQAQYDAGRAERRNRAVDPDNRLVARGLETEWNQTLQALADAEAEPRLAAEIGVTWGDTEIDDAERCETTCGYTEGVDGINTPLPRLGVNGGMSPRRRCA